MTAILELLETALDIQREAVEIVFALGKQLVQAAVRLQVAQDLIIDAPNERDDLVVGGLVHRARAWARVGVRVRSMSREGYAGELAPNLWSGASEFDTSLASIEASDGLLQVW